MPREISHRPHVRADTPQALREMAGRARRLAAGILDEQAIANLTAFAAELEVRAAALEPAAQIFSYADAAAVQRGRG
jgi:hypothetical protein